MGLLQARVLEDLLGGQLVYFGVPWNLRYHDPMLVNLGVPSALLNLKACRH